MKKNISLMVIATLLLSSSLTCVFAHNEVKEMKIKDSAKDCEFLYLLKEDGIEKLSLPNFTSISSVKLPALTRGRSISIAGGCSDPTETILVFAKQKSNGDKDVLLSYDENLQLVAQLTIKENNNDNDDNDVDHHD